MPTKSVLFCTLLGLATASGLAQTARIAHLSHSGNVATLDAAADNFGIVGPCTVPEDGA